MKYSIALLGLIAIAVAAPAGIQGRVVEAAPENLLSRDVGRENMAARNYVIDRAAREDMAARNYVIDGMDREDMAARNYYSDSE
ncbi:hypothetical protein F5Y15DRAFT_418065 [Xylariaceae sp. FL0016]|nr:hypothetical protein F5Y15DRAFT_418065 [Xylariaceae sp. FL0016]